MNQEEYNRLLNWFNNTCIRFHKKTPRRSCDTVEIRSSFSNLNNMKEVIRLLNELNINPKPNERIQYWISVCGKKKLDILFDYFENDISPKRKQQREAYRRLENTKTFTVD